jgi:hypothetical protein
MRPSQPLSGVIAGIDPHTAAGDSLGPLVAVPLSILRKQVLQRDRPMLRRDRLQPCEAGERFALAAVAADGDRRQLGHARPRSRALIVVTDERVRTDRAPWTLPSRVYTFH